MTLATGSRLGVYEIVELVGLGGMGEVYRARDSRLDRDVAIKILPELFAGDPERVARFEREARVLASVPESPEDRSDLWGLEESSESKFLEEKSR